MLVESKVVEGKDNVPPALRSCHSNDTESKASVRHDAKLFVISRFLARLNLINFKINDMTDEEILENNKVIASFMNDGTGSRIWQSDGMGGKISYDTSWDWLMPVVRKIAGMMLNKDWHNLQTALKRWKPIANELEKVDKENVWFCVVQFIKWYNKSKNAQSAPSAQ